MFIAVVFYNPNCPLCAVGSYSHIVFLKDETELFSFLREKIQFGYTIQDLWNTLDYVRSDLQIKYETQGHDYRGVSVFWKGNFYGRVFADPYGDPFWKEEKQFSTLQEFLDYCGSKKD